MKVFVYTYIYLLTFYVLVPVLPKPLYRSNSQQELHIPTFGYVVCCGMYALVTACISSLHTFHEVQRHYYAASSGRQKFATCWLRNMKCTTQRLSSAAKMDIRGAIQESKFVLNLHIPAKPSLFCFNPKVTPTSYLELINSFKDVLPLVSWMAFCHKSSGLDAFGISSRPEMRNYRIQSSMPKTNEAQLNMLHQYS